MDELPERFRRNDYCQCGHCYGAHRWWGRRKANNPDASACAHCACESFARDPTGCAQSKRLTPREQNETLTEAGMQYVNTVDGEQLRADLDVLGLYGKNYTTRIHHVLKETRPFSDLAALKRSEGFGRKAWGVLIALLRSLGHVALTQGDAWRRVKCPRCACTFRVLELPEQRNARMPNLIAEDEPAAERG